ncbi:hypothetical protein FGB62_30g032 [Gracilaria domingensis]|nr:hypothetical protein FGB62_30g032 [Gracilaria domingensis]
MSDLNDFFAKKDRKKKKAAAKSAQAAAAQAVKQSETTSENQPQTPPQKVPDDGWIEIEDVRGSQVNTGGRTIVQLRRDGEEKETNPDGNATTEKFSGWAKTEEAPTDEEAATAAQAPSSAFPTLADAAKVKKIAPKQSSEPPSTARRPRFTLANREKLLQALTGDREPMRPPK